MAPFTPKHRSDGQHEHNNENEISTAKAARSSPSARVRPRKTSDKKLPDLPTANVEFTKDDMAEAEKLFKEEHAALFDLPKKQDDEIVEKAQSDGAEVDGEDEISILPLEVEIVEETQIEEKPKKRVKCNSAGQEPPPVPVKPAYLRTISMTSG